MNAIGFLNQRSKTFLLTTGLVLVASLGLLNFFAGPDVSFLIFYVLPVFLASWFVGRGAGLWMCLASGLTWVVVSRDWVEHYTNPAVPYWNAAVSLGFMVILACIVSALKRSHEQERELARTDYLTGAVNGRHFAEVAALEISRAERHGHQFSVAYMDVDDFKLVNDRHGHSAGDRLLRAVAETMREGVRDIDVVARLGGDEFAVLLPETDAVASQVVIRRVRRRLLDLAREHGWPVTYSIGVITWDEPPADVDGMLRAADDLMYSAKRNGKNRVQHRVLTRSATAA